MVYNNYIETLAERMGDALREDEKCIKEGRMAMQKLKMLGQECPSYLKKTTVPSNFR